MRSLENKLEILLSIGVIRSLGIRRRKKVVMIGRKMERKKKRRREVKIMN